MPNIKSTLYALLLVIYSTAYTQNIESLKKEIENRKIHDTTKLYKIALAIESLPSNDTNCVKLNQIMGKIATKNLRRVSNNDLFHKYTKYLAAYYSNLSAYYQLQNDVYNTITNLDKSINLFKSINALDEMNYVTVNKGVFYSQINEKEKAIKNLFIALKYFEKNADDNQSSIAYVNSVVATIYADQKKYDKAISYIERTINYLNSKKILDGEETFRLNEAFLNCGTYKLNQKNFSQAIIYFNKALSFYKKTQNNQLISICLCKIAQAKMEQESFTEAENLLQEALNVCDSNLSKANAYINFGDLYYRKKELNKAENFLSDGFYLSKKINNLQLQEKASSLLLRVCKENKNFKKALEIYEFQAKLNDSSKIESSKNALAQQQLKYSFEKKQLNTELKAEKKNFEKNILLIILSALLLLVLFGSYFYYRNNKQKQEITTLEKDRIKQKLLLSQMNPHFIFNSIDNIQSLILNNKETVAVSYLNQFSKLTRQILENSNENYISLQEEINMLTNYLSIQQLLYKDRFDFSIKTENILDAELLFIPPMLAQPFIENAIKHGIKNRNKKGNIQVLFLLKQSNLFFQIIDNGIGFSNQEQQSNHKSMAIKITKERLLNYTKNNNIEIKLENLLDDNENIVGAKVEFEIPYLYEN